MIEVKEQVLALRHPFSLATGTSDERRTLHVRITSPSGDFGEGEAAPIRYRFETLSSVRAELSQLDRELSSLWPLFEELVQGNATSMEVGGPLARLEDRLARVLPEALTARCAVSVALYDLLGKRRGVPLHGVLSLAAENAPRTCMTIGIAEESEVLARVDDALAAGLDVLKIKCGAKGAWEQEVALLSRLRERHPGALMVDANGGWNIDTAVQAAKALEPLRLTLLEQPTARGDTAAWGRIHAGSPSLPLFADEDSQTLADLDHLGPAVAGINVKLMKCGGIAEGLRMIAWARERGLSVMLGCMVQSSLGITAAAHLSPLVDLVDLDAPLLLANDPWRGVTFVGNRLVLPTAPGIGARPVRS